MKEEAHKNLYTICKQNSESVICKRRNNLCSADLDEWGDYSKHIYSKFEIWWFVIFHTWIFIIYIPLFPPPHSTSGLLVYIFIHFYSSRICYRLFQNFLFFIFCYIPALYFTVQFFSLLLFVNNCMSLFNRFPDLPAIMGIY